MVARRQAPRFSDKDGKIFVLTVADKKVVEIADDAFGGVTDYAWSPDSAYLAFSLGNLNGNNTLYIWSAADGKLRARHRRMWNAQSPAWDPKGKYLFYLSDREFAPQISTFEWNFATNRTTGDLRAGAAQGRASTRSRPRATR